ncbi:Trm112 family protein [Inquilinus sp. NPDC058860]|uniref:Trm112 family protein n=1 Tax=Inquilinus sp. NPDC058860 TaxID=3346652 RepID=UPI003685366C
MSDTSEPGSAAGSSSPAPSPTGVDPRLLEMLVCPLTKSPLRYDAKAQELISDQARLAYPIRDGIPIMLIDEARPLDPDARR